MLHNSISVTNSCHGFSKIQDESNNNLMFFAIFWLFFHALIVSAANNKPTVHFCPRLITFHTSVAGLLSYKPERRNYHVLQNISWINYSKLKPERRNIKRNEREAMYVPIVAVVAECGGWGCDVEPVPARMICIYLFYSFVFVLFFVFFVCTILLKTSSVDKFENTVHRPK